MRLCSALVFSSIASCQAVAGSQNAVGTRTITVAAPDLPELALDDVRVEPGGTARHALRIGKTLELVLDATQRKVVIHAPEACPLSVPDASGASSLEPLRLVPLITLSGPAADVGFDARFEVTVRAGCNAVKRGSLAWSVEGAPLAEFSVLDAGTRIVARTAELPARLGTWPAGRIVPVSPAERGSTRLVVRWTSPTGKLVVRSIVVSAAPRARGLPNVGLGERVLLAGTGYTVRSRPEGSHADPMPWDARANLSSIVPDVPGIWELEPAAGPILKLQAGRYDAVPLDCGRTECHAAETHAAQSSPMTASLARRLDSPEGPSAVACTFGCHTTGEPGTTDGGFSHALSDLEIDGTHLPAWDALPRSLRRLGGVGCLGCHGPAQIPEESARWAILRADVCGYCHDAPPRYEHVKAWRTTTLAHSDMRLETRIQAECARCHTTWGFLESVTAADRGVRMPPSDEPPMGITCVACHAVHSENVSRPALLRRVAISPIYAVLPESAIERSSACISCHTPDATGGPSSALLWAGQGAEDPVAGTTLIGPAPHAAVPGGCVGCHGASPANGATGMGHTFRADPSRCSSCHAERPVDHSIFERARHLMAHGGAHGLQKPPHARPQPVTTPQDRALALVRLVLEDRGAAVHNPGYAKLLLDRAATLLASPSGETP